MFGSARAAAPPLAPSLLPLVPSAVIPESAGSAISGAEADSTLARFGVEAGGEGDAMAGDWLC